MYTESNYENGLVQLFQDELGYDFVNGPEIDRDYKKVVLEDILLTRLRHINKKAHRKAIDEALRKILNPEGISLIQQNRNVHDMIVNGVDVSYHDGAVKSDHIKLIDYENVKNNSFLLVNQYTVVENQEKRPDIIVFINGLPLVVMELKSCSRENTNTSKAYKQIRNYLQDIPSLFAYNSFCVISDMGTSTKAGTITADEDRYMMWKSVDGEKIIDSPHHFEVLFKGMFEKQRLLHIVKNYVLFLSGSDGDIKILSGYHQFFGVEKAVAHTQDAVNGDGKIGIFWHTQGSGKSLSMVFYTKLIDKLLNNPTIVVLTDRNDLDDQLFGTFAKASEYLRQTPIQAESRRHLKELLEGRQAGGIVFTTIQKFEEDTGLLSKRKNIIFIADEAHRSQYGLNAKVDASTGKIKYGMAHYVRESLPNAAFIGFTGTPIDLLDRSTPEVFGDYIDIYDMTQSVKDKATVPIFYENRVMHLKLDKKTLDEIDREYEKVAEEAEDYHVERSKKELSRMESLLGADETISELVGDIISHYEDRKTIVKGKALILALNRRIAIKIYDEILRNRPGWTDKVKIVMTGGNDDPEEWKKHTGNKEYRDHLAVEFKKVDSEFKIAIVVDMWLTGFDVPALDTMYIYKPMQGHTLMQAIARVNRVFADKEGGLVVDYAGIAEHLKEAMKKYTNRDNANYGDPDIRKKALPAFMEQLEICRDLLHGLDYSLFFTGRDLDRANLIVQGIDFVLADDERKTNYLKHAQKLRKAETLCRSLLDEKTRLEYAFFEAIRTAIIRMAGPGFSVEDINKRINVLLQQSIKSNGVVSVFKELPEFSIFDPAYLRNIGNMKQKNVAVEMLKRLLKDNVSDFKTTNVVQSELFSEKMDKLMNKYNNRMITNAEVIQELLKMAEEIREMRDEADKLGLSKEEKAFYDALSKPKGIHDIYNDDKLKEMTEELTKMLRNNRTIDWQFKESARARMRSMVKRLLKKYDYPPKERKDALETVIKQAELWAYVG